MHQIRFAPDPAVELTTLAGPTVGCEGRYPSLFTPSERLRHFSLGDWDASTLDSTPVFHCPLLPRILRRSTMAPDPVYNGYIVIQI